MNSLEIITILTSIISGIVSITLFSNHVFENIESNMLSLKKGKAQLQEKIEELEKENQKNKKINIAACKVSNIQIHDFNEILVNENRRLHAKCNMLEEEIRKTTSSIIT
jgi:hypothetical protein